MAKEEGDDELASRLMSHNNAFESLLDLIPSKLYYAQDTSNQWRKRKQTKLEAKEAKKAKLDPANSASSAMDVRLREQQAAKLNHQENEQDGESADGELASDPPKDQPHRPEKKSGTKKRKKPDGPETSGSTQTDTDPSRATENEQANQDTVEDKQAPDESQRPSIAELRAKLASKIESLRQKRNAPGTVSKNGESPSTRESILEARRRKKDQKKAARKERKEAEKAAKQDRALENADTETKPSKQENGSHENHSNGYLYGNFDMDDAEIQYDEAGNKIKSKRNKTDIRGHLKSIEAKKARVAGYDPEKQEHINDSDTWHAALLASRGEKVRVNEAMLRKTVKRKDQQKKRSERQWRDRLENTQNSIKMREKKREENLQKRQDGPKNGKSKKPKKPKPHKKPRAGFEGSVKARSGK